MFLTVCGHMKSWSEVNSVLMQILLPLCVSTTNNRTVQNYPQPGNQTARSPPTCEVYTNLNQYFQITYLKPQYLWYFFKQNALIILAIFLSLGIVPQNHFTGIPLTKTLLSLCLYYSITGSCLACYDKTEKEVESCTRFPKMINCDLNTTVTRCEELKASLIKYCKSEGCQGTKVLKL